VPRLLAILAVFAALGFGAADAAAAGPQYVAVGPPASGKVAGFRIDEAQAIRIARRAANPRLAPGQRRARAVPLVFAQSSWVVNLGIGNQVVASVQIDGRTGAVQHLLTGREVQWPQIYHGVHSAQGHRVNVGMAILAVLFLVPFARPPLRRAHLDLLALLAIGVSFVFAAAGNVWVATPLIYPPLLFLVYRMTMAAARGGTSGLDTWMPTRWLIGAVVAVLLARYAYDVIDGFVSDVGYASIYGADSIRHGYDIYDSSPGGGNLDTYGPFAYLAYLPFTAVLPFDLTRAHVGAAQFASIVFDLATVGGLYVLGRQVRDSRLGWLLAWGFAAFPFTFLPLTSNTNDALVAALLTWTLVAARFPVVRGLLLGLATATKFAPVTLAGVFLRVGRERGLKPAAAYALIAAATAVLVVVAYLPDGGLREFYDATIGFQLHRASPFSMWGLHPSWRPAHWAMEALAVALAVGAIWIPRRRTTLTLAAMGAAVIIATQLTAIHWYWFYVPWFLPYALVAILADGRGPSSEYSSNSPIAKSGANHAT
jgi:hypothetical protein